MPAADPQAPPTGPQMPAAPPRRSRNLTSTDDDARAPVAAPCRAVPQHCYLTSPTASHPRALPLHVVLLIVSYLDDVADLARIARTSRLLYYLALPRLYEAVTLRSYADIRYTADGRPQGYGGASPFAMALNTLMTRPFAEYVQSFRVVGDWREHDVDDYSKGRVPDNSMMLQIAMRAVLDRMKDLTAFAWELNTKPLQTVYQGLMTKPSISSLTLRCQTKRIPRPTTVIPPLPNLRTLVLYDMDPLCYPDDVSVLFAHATKLENLKLHWNPRMRESGEESVNLLNYFGRCIAAKLKLPIKRFAMYNLYARNFGDGFGHCFDDDKMMEVTLVNSMGSSDPMTVFLDDTWRVNNHHPVPQNLKMIRSDAVDREQVKLLWKNSGLERYYLISKRASSSPSSIAATPVSPTRSASTPFGNNVSAQGMAVSEHQCKGMASDFLAVIQSNHRTMRHMLLSDHWQLSDNALFKLCQSCPDLEQLGFACAVPPLDSLRQCISLVPKLWAIRFLIRPGSELAEKMESIEEMQQFLLGTEFWKPEYKNLKYLGFGDHLVYRLGEVTYPPKSIGQTPGLEGSMNGRITGPYRELIKLDRKDVQHVEIWGMDSGEFDPKFP